MCCHERDPHLDPLKLEDPCTMSQGVDWKRLIAMVLSSLLGLPCCWKGENGMI